jgi:hypothetical protein
VDRDGEPLGTQGRRALVDPHLPSALGKRDRGGEAGKARPGNLRPAFHGAIEKMDATLPSSIMSAALQRGETDAR